MKTKFVFVLGAMILLVISSFKIAKAETVSYQGILTDSSGDPVPDSSFSIQFSLWDDSTGGAMLWTELHPSVQTVNGRFMVNLGSIDPIPTATFEAEIVALELTAGGDPPMVPRIIISLVPKTGVSRRLSGDYITTQPGILEIHPPEPGMPPDPFYPGIILSSDSLLNLIELHPPEPCMPPDPCIPAIELKVDSTTSLVMHPPSEYSVDSFFDVYTELDQTELSLQTFPSAGSTGAQINLLTNASMADLTLQNLPVIGGPAGSSMNMMSNNGEAEFSMQALPSPGETSGEVALAVGPLGSSFQMSGTPTGAGLPLASPMVELMAADSGGSFNMYLPDVGSIMEINTSPNDGLIIRGFNPQPEPPADPAQWFAINTTPGVGPSHVMFNPQPEPPGSDPWLQMMTDVYGPSIKMTAETNIGGGALQIASPMVEISADSIGSEFILQRKFMSSTGAPDSTRIHLQVDSTKAEMKFFGGGNSPSFEVHTDNGEPKVLIGNPAASNILTIKRTSSTDPVADAWTTYSSRRWKRNIEPIENSIDKVMNLRGVSFEWKNGGKKDIGLVAEEVAEVIPEIVAFEQNGVDAQSVDYSRLVAVLIEATKEQQKEIEELKTEIKQLQNR